MTIRKFFTLTTILFAAFSFVSCSSDDDDNDEPNNGVDGNHEYVDLGLPSGTLWATCNVGASKPEEYGNYFAWGEIEPKKTYGLDNYKWGGGKMTKYCVSSRDGVVDNNLELLPEDDAATANWGSDWCMPSFDQVLELISEKNTTTEWTTLNGVDCMKMTSKKNGKTLFLPAAGTGNPTGVALYDEGKFGFYWTRSLDEFASANANDLFIGFPSSYGYGSVSRAYGYSVRPVRSSK